MICTNHSSSRGNIGGVNGNNGFTAGTNGTNGFLGGTASGINGTNGFTGGTGDVTGSIGGIDGGSDDGGATSGQPGTPLKASCGDGIVQSQLGEMCDRGSTCTSDANSCNRAPGTPDATCTCNPGDPACPALPGSLWERGCTTALCGDGAVNSPYVLDGKAVNFQGIHEICDNGADNGKPGNPCNSTCQIVATTFCGNGSLDPGEQCDDGVGNSDTTPDACRTNCGFARCGDGIIDMAEQCDDGNIQSGDGCSTLCVSESPSAPTTIAQIIDLPFLSGQQSSTLTQVATSRPPSGETGPGAVLAIAAGAAAGYAIMRRRQLKKA